MYVGREGGGGGGGGGRRGGVLSRSQRSLARVSARCSPSFSSVVSSTMPLMSSMPSLPSMSSVSSMPSVSSMSSMSSSGLFFLYVFFGFGMDVGIDF